MTAVMSSFNRKGTHGQPSGDVLEEHLLLDKMRSGFDIPSDAALAAWLGVDKSTIYFVRAGSRRLGLLQRLKVLDRIGFLKTGTFVEGLLPENLAMDLLNLNKTTPACTALVSLETENANIKLIDAVKTVFGLTTDATLAAFLGIKATTISMIRAGKSGLGPIPKLKLLGIVTGEFQADDVIGFVDSSSRLALAIDTWQSSRSPDTGAAGIRAKTAICAQPPKS